MSKLEVGIVAGARPASRSGRVVAMAIAAVAVAAVPALLARTPTVRAPGVVATLETALACAAFAAAARMHSRFAASARMRDLLAAVAVADLGLMSLVDRVLPDLLGLGGETSLLLGLWGRLVVACGFAAIVVVPADRLLTRRRQVRKVVGGAAAAIVLTAGVGWLALGPLLLGRPGTGALGAAARPWVAYALGAVEVALLVASSLRLADGDGGAEDGVTAALAAACALLAAAAVCQLVRGPLAAGALGAVELPRLGAYAVLLLTAIRHEPRLRANIARAAALAERRRVARDLHDGLAQDLAFIAAQGPALCEQLGERHPLVVAARRALAVSRTTIDELSDPAAVTVSEALEAIAHELREQFDVAIAVNVGAGVEVDAGAREHIARISREAIANAVRHGGARNVAVSLSSFGRATVLRIVDDGCGMPEATGADAPGEGFGLAGMRDRAAALGGYLSLHRPRWGGTEVEVVFR